LPSAARCPVALRRWLTYPGSITLALGSACGEPPTVHLLASRLDSPAISEQRFLQRRTGQPVLARDIQLRARGQVWVRARSVTPADPDNPLLRLVGQLGSRSLGDRLFLARGKATPERHWLRYASQPEADGYWGRVALWQVFGRPLLVQEYFSPALADEAPPPSRYTARRLR
jgi:chorismate lyase